jgi:hypothetical protein
MLWRALCRRPCSTEEEVYSPLKLRPAAGVGWQAHPLLAGVVQNAALDRR